MGLGIIPECHIAAFLESILSSVPPSHVALLWSELKKKIKVKVEDHMIAAQRPKTCMD